MIEDNLVLYYFWRTEGPENESGLLMDCLELYLIEKGFRGNLVDGISYEGVTVKISDSSREVRKGYSSNNIQVLLRKHETSEDFSRLYGFAEDIVMRIRNEIISSSVDIEDERHVDTIKTLGRS